MTHFSLPRVKALFSHWLRLFEVKSKRFFANAVEVQVKIRKGQLLNGSQKCYCLSQSAQSVNTELF
jgi:hypothetical protein